MMLQKIKQVYRWDYFPFIILGILMLIMHAFMKEGIRDDAYFSVQRDDIFAYLQYRYNNWSSRIVIEGVVILVFKLSFLLWKWMNTLIYVLIGILLSKLFVKANDRNANWFIVGMLVIYPFYHMESAGWVTTNIFYLYALFLLLFCLFEVKRAYENKKLFWYEYLFYFFALLFATSMEQITAMLVVFFPILIINAISKKNYHHIFGLSFFICMLQILIVLTCPGNVLRQIQETATWFPAYGGLTIFDKLNLGFYTTILQFFSSRNGIFFVFGFLLFLAILFKYRNIWYCLIAAIPCFLWGIFIVVWLLPKTPVAFLIQNNRFLESLEKIFEIGHIQSVPSEAIILSLGLLPLLAFMIYLVVLAFDKSEIWFVLLVLALGFGSRVMLGFSPTIYASSYRTSIYFYFSLIVCTILLMNKQLSIVIKKKPLVYIFCFICIISYFANIYYTASA